VDGYPQSPYRADAKLGVGDSYLGEGHSDSLVLGANEFREFLTFFPLHPRADYAQYHLALTQFKQILGPQRDQTATRDALTELQHFIDRYPTSTYRSEVDTLYREARDRLSESEYRVGLFYYRSKWYPGAKERLEALIKDDPDYGSRDAVYYYLGESLIKLRLQPQALPYFERLLAEHPKSEYRDKAERRVAELKVKH
jgi:outer membrane protein assembly factor BamD